MRAARSSRLVSRRDEVLREVHLEHILPSWPRDGPQQPPGVGDGCQVLLLEVGQDSLTFQFHKLLRSQVLGALPSLPDVNEPCAERERETHH